MCATCVDVFLVGLALVSILCLFNITTTNCFSVLIFVTVQVLRLQLVLKCQIVKTFQVPLILGLGTNDRKLTTVPNGGLDIRDHVWPRTLAP